MVCNSVGPQNIARHRSEQRETGKREAPPCDLGIALNIVSILMRACQYDADSPAGVKLTEDVRKPIRSRSHALIRVHAAGVNPVDAKFIIGDKLPESWMAWAARRATGHTPGFDFSGVVTDIEPINAAGLSIGDEVFGFACNPAHFVLRPCSSLHGSFAEYIAAPINQIAKKPQALTHTEAAALPLVGTTALQAFSQHQLRKGQRLLVIGASGGVGHVAVQVATHLGVHVTAVCSSKNVVFVEECGASVVLSYDDGDIFAKIGADAATNGAYDLCFDCVSSADARDTNASYAARLRTMQPRVLRKGPGVDAHNYVVLGGATGSWATALVKRFLKINCFPKGFELFWIKMPGAHRVLAQLAALADAPDSDSNRPKPLRPKVDSRLAFSEVAAREAFEALRGRRTAGKIVMEIAQSEPL